MPKATLTICSKNYSSWCLRGWLLCKLAGLDFEEELVSLDDPVRTRRAAAAVAVVPGAVPDARRRQGVGYAGHRRIPGGDLPAAGLLPKDRAARAHCRAICGEMHSGFYNLRSALPMNLKAHHPGFKVWAGAQADIERVAAIWRECLERYGGPYLFGGSLTMADAMYAPVCTRFLTYDVKLDPECAAYCRSIMEWPAMVEWVAGRQGRARRAGGARRGVLSAPAPRKATFTPLASRARRARRGRADSTTAQGTRSGRAGRARAPSIRHPLRATTSALKVRRTNSSRPNKT